MSTATNKHRLACALALRTVSPSLSALHASRLRLRPEPDERIPAPAHAPPLTSLTCVQCGHASVRVRIVSVRRERRTQSNTTPRVVQRTCPTCAFVERIPAPRGAAVLFGRTNRRSAAGSAAPPPATSGDALAVHGTRESTPRAVPTAPNTPPVPSAPPSRASLPPKKRAKKKQGLHDLLARNRERQRHQDPDAASGGGLASFLGGL